MMTMLCHFSGEAPDPERYSDSDFVSARLVFFFNITSSPDKDIHNSLTGEMVQM